jgi:glycerophosphoryl diester phosphodiesterase
MDSGNSTSPLVFAHRGASAALPEHTRGAYERAIDDGVDGLECDVRLTRDGHLVCIHDASIERTSTGSGRVSRMTLDELDRHDYGSWHPGTPPGAAHPAGILTFDALLVLALDAGRPLRLLVETKHPSRFGGEVERRLVQLLVRHGLHTTAGARERGVAVTVMSFSALALRRVRVLAPDISTVFLFDVAAPSVWQGRAPVGAEALGPSLAAVRRRPEVVRRAHDRGNQVFVWTVNETADIDRVAALGVEGIISDRPRDVLATLGRSPSSPPRP